MSDHPHRPGVLVVVADILVADCSRRDACEASRQELSVVPPQCDAGRVRRLPQGRRDPRAIGCRQNQGPRGKGRHRTRPLDCQRMGRGRQMPVHGSQIWVIGPT